MLSLIYKKLKTVATLFNIIKKIEILQYVNN
jgi:hypothetical protein